jgi:hypothetical protein
MEVGNLAQNCTKNGMEVGKLIQLGGILLIGFSLKKLRRKIKCDGNQQDNDVLLNRKVF